MEKKSKIGVLVLLATFLFSGCSTLSMVEPKDWINNKEVIAIRYKDYFAGFQNKKVVKSEIQFCSVNTKTKVKKVLKRVVIRNPRGRVTSGFIPLPNDPQYSQGAIGFLYEKDQYRQLYMQRIPEYSINDFHGIGRINSLSYNRQRDFVAFDTDNNEIFVMDINTGIITKKLRGHYPRWNEDGFHLLYMDGPYIMMFVNGSDAATKLQWPGYYHSLWYPKGLKILALQEGNVCLFHAYDSGKKSLFSIDVGSYLMDISPDGKNIVIDGRNPKLYSLDQESDEWLPSEKKTSVSPGLYNFKFSPDGKSILYVKLETFNKVPRNFIEPFDISNFTILRPKELMQKLKDPDYQKRIEALDALIKEKYPLIAENLIQATKDENPEVRKKAALLLINIRRSAGDVRFDKALIDLAQDSDKGVRLAAVTAYSLGALGSQGSKPLSKIISGDPDEEVRIAALQELDKIYMHWNGDPVLLTINWIAEPIKVLIVALNDENKTIRALSARKLQSITGKNLGEKYVAWRQWWEAQTKTELSK